AVCLLAAGSTLAQQGPPRGFGGPGGPMGFGGGSAMLLLLPEVQKELKLTADQKSKLTAQQQKMRLAMQQAMQQYGPRLQNATPEERQQIFAEVQKAMADAQAQQAKEVSAILTDDQQKRLKQIQWQQQGNMALTDPEVAAALKLTEEQQQ